MLEIPPKLGFRADKYDQNMETAHEYGQGIKAFLQKILHFWHVF